MAVNEASRGTKEVRTHSLSHLAIGVIIAVSGITGAVLEKSGSNALEAPASASPAVVAHGTTVPKAPSQ